MERIRHCLTRNALLGFGGLILIAVALIGGTIGEADADGLVPISKYWLRVAAATSEWECVADDRRHPNEVHCYRDAPEAPEPVICNTAFSGHAPKDRAGDGPTVRYRVNYGEEGDHGIDGTPHPDGWIPCPERTATPIPPTTARSAAVPAPTATSMPTPVPTATPLPTATPTATPTPLPTATATPVVIYITEYIRVVVTATPTMEGW